MKKLFFPLIILAMMVCFGGSVLAAPNLGNKYMDDAAVLGGYQAGAASDTAFASQIGGYIRIALSFVGSIFFVLVLYAGFLWMTAAGEDEKIKKAKDILKSATIGLAITLGAYSITAFVVPRVMSQSQTNTGTTQTQ